MEWRDQGTLLSVRRHGETSAILEVFTVEHGRHAGVVRGGTSRKLAPVLQPGAQLDLTWRARLDEHIGSFTVEPLFGRAAAIMDDRLALAGLNAVTSLLVFCLPEREPHPKLYERTITLLDMLVQSPHWPLAYLRWEMTLLEDMGFGLDLSACAATGVTDDLIYISPKSGRAVSAAGAGEWSDRLLPLSPALLGKGEGAPEDVVAGMVATGFFLKNWLTPALGEKPLPQPRQRLLDLLSRQGRMA